jgi:HlyD family secretion protein
MSFCARVLAVVTGLTVSVAVFGDPSGAVSSLGRVEPHHGVYRLSGPSETSVVAKLRVEEGDRVTAGQVLATLDSHDLRVTELKRAEVELEHSRRVLARQQALRQNSFQSAAAFDEAERDVHVWEAEVAAAQARLALSDVRAPEAGEVLDIHAREGERIGPDGLLELGRTDQMYVIAEVYETDIGRVAVGQPARITSPVLANSLTGKVERIGQMVARNDVLGLDPVARIDARIVEVFILLDDPAAVSSLTNLQVNVEIGG